MADALDALLDAPKGAPAPQAAPAPAAPVAAPANAKMMGVPAVGPLKFTPEGYPYYDSTPGAGDGPGGAPVSGPGTAIPQDAPLQDPSSALEAAVGGAANAGFQASDAALEIAGGGDVAGDKSELRKAAEARTAALDKDPINGLASGIAQFGVGFLGLGKVLKPLAVGTTLIRDGKVLNALVGAATGATVLDPHEQRLDNFIQSVPALQNPVSEFLAAKPDDSQALGRFKNAVENLIVPGVVEGGVAAAKATGTVLTSLVEAVKLRRAGNTPAANAAVATAEEALAKAAKFKGAKPNANAQNANAVPAAGAGGPGGAAPAQSGGLNNPAVATDGAGVTGLERVPPGERVTPKPAPRAMVELTPEEFDKLVSAAQKDTGAILDAGSYDAAAASGHAFAETDLIPYQKLATGNERVDAWLSRVVDEHTDYINKARGGNADGVMTDRQVNLMVGRLGAIAGEDPALIRGMLLQAGADAKLMAAKMDTAFIISQKAFADSYGMVMRINAGNYGEALTREAATVQAKARMAVAVEMFAAAKAILASGGRVVRRAQAQFDSQTLAAMGGMKANLDRMGGQDFLDLMTSTGGNPQAIADKVVPGTFARVVNFATMNQAAGLIWGWSTATVIAVADVSALYLRPLAAFAGSHIMAGKAMIAGDDALLATAASMRARARKEMLITHTFLDDAWHASVFAFKTGDSQLSPHYGAMMPDAGNSFQAGRLGSGDLRPAVANWVPVKDIHDVAYNALQSAMYLGSNPADLLGMPFRFHGALQEYMQVLRYRAVVTAKADQEALAMGLEPPHGGWSGEAAKPYTDHVSGRVRDSFDASGQGTDLEALAEARAGVFQSKLIGSGTSNTWGDLPTAGAVAQQLAANFPPFKLIAPYIAIPANIFRYSNRLTPGLNLLQKEYLNDITGKNGPPAQAKATGEMMMGIMLAVKGMQMRMDGRLTGSGPTDPKMASSWREDGHQADSIVSTDKDGKKSYFQIHRFEPYTGPLVFWADVADIMMQGHAGENPQPDLYQRAISAALLATMHIIKDKTALQSISQVMDAMQDDNKLEAWFKKWSPGMVPGSSLLKGGNQMFLDPYLREADGVLGGIKAILPGFSQTLPKRLDAYGDPVLIPAKFTSERKNNGPLGNALEENYAATGHYPMQPSPKQGGVDLRDLQTEKGHGAYERFQELAGHPKGMPSMKEALEKVVSTKSYQGLTHGKPSEAGTRENVIEQIMAGYHQAGIGALRQESPKVNSAMTQRARDIMGQNQTRQSDIRAASAAAGAKALNDLLAPYGMSLPVPSTNVPKAQP